MQPDQKSVGRNRVETQVLCIGTKAMNKRQVSRNHYAVIHCRPVSHKKKGGFRRFYGPACIVNPHIWKSWKDKHEILAGTFSFKLKTSSSGSHQRRGTPPSPSPSLPCSCIPILFLSTTCTELVHICLDTYLCLSHHNTSTNKSQKSSYSISPTTPEARARYPHICRAERCHYFSLAELQDRWRNIWLGRCTASDIAG
jgi:hypothetical protein